MRKKGAKGAPKASDFKRAKQTAKSLIMTKLCPRGKSGSEGVNLKFTLVCLCLTPTHLKYVQVKLKIRLE